MRIYCHISGFLFFSVFMQFALAQVAGPNSGGTFGAKALSASSGSWNNSSNVTALDGVYSVSDPLVNSPTQQYSNYLQVTNFGFAIPSGAVITGMQLYITWHASSAKVNDYSIRLIQGDMLSPNDKTTHATIPNSDVTTVYGGSTDTWGTSWTDLNINASNFGALIAVERDASGSVGGTMNIDYVTMTIYYAVPLPVELLAFNAFLENNRTVKTQWSTATELNNDYFSVERSKDGITFENIGTILGAGTSSTIHDYSFSDKLEITYKVETIYYRLKQTDYNGQYKYYPPASVQIKPFDFIIYPSISTGVFFINGIEGNADVIVYSRSGEKIYQSNITNSQSTINISFQPSGIYFLKITYQDGSSAVRQIIKE